MVFDKPKIVCYRHKIMNFDQDHYSYLNIPRTSELEVIDEAIIMQFDDDSESMIQEGVLIESEKVDRQKKILALIRDFDSPISRLEYDRSILNMAYHGEIYQIANEVFLQQLQSIETWFEAKLDQIQAEITIDTMVKNHLMEVGTLDEAAHEFALLQLKMNMDKKVSRFGRLRLLKIEGARAIRDNQIKKSN